MHRNILLFQQLKRMNWHNRLHRPGLFFWKITLQKALEIMLQEPITPYQLTGLRGVTVA